MMKDRKCTCFHYESRHQAEDRQGWTGSGQCNHERCDCIVFEDVQERQAADQRNEDAIVAGESRYRQSVLGDEA